MTDEIEVGEYRLVKDFEHGMKPVKVVKPAPEVGEGYWWCRYSDGGLYDFHESDLKPM